MVTNKKNKIGNSIIIILSIIGLIVCITVLFPQVRRMMLDYLIEHVVHREISSYQVWFDVLLSYAVCGICCILFLDYFTLINSGKSLVRNVKQEIKDCWSEIDFRSFSKPLILLIGVYFLGILTIVRANFLYRDDIWRAVESIFWQWFGWSRYVSVFSSFIVHADINLTDISPLPQLLAMVILSISSLLLVYVIGKKRITVVRLLASIPLGLSPFILENLSYKFDPPYNALSILASIVPFLFIARRKAFLFVSVLSLLVMCTTYQAASGIYMMIVVILCFQYWSNKEKTNKEILSFIGTAAIAFCFSILFFKFFLMRPVDVRASGYISNSMFPASHIISGILGNIKAYAMNVNHYLNITWGIGIVIVLLFFIAKSVCSSAQKKIRSFFASILVIGLLFILSFGLYYFLEAPLLAPRAMYGFGVFLAIMCISVVSDYKKIAVVAVLALNWCFLVFAFSYGNALADQARYAEFRITILLNDLSVLYPDVGREDLSIQVENPIDFTPLVKNTAKHYPLIEELVPTRMGRFAWDDFYYLEYFNYISYKKANWPVDGYIDFRTLDLPVVLDSYYHTIKSDGEHVLVILKH